MVAGVGPEPGSKLNSTNDLHLGYGYTNLNSTAVRDYSVDDAERSWSGLLTLSNSSIWRWITQTNTYLVNGDSGGPTFILTQTGWKLLAIFSNFSLKEARVTDLRPFSRELFKKRLWNSYEDVVFENYKFKSITTDINHVSILSESYDDEFAGVNTEIRCSFNGENYLWDNPHQFKARIRLSGFCRKLVDDIQHHPEAAFKIGLNRNTGEIDYYYDSKGIPYRFH